MVLPAVGGLRFFVGELRFEAGARLDFLAQATEIKANAANCNQVLNSKIQNKPEC
jgi:hypothetical protein